MGQAQGRRGLGRIYLRGRVWWVQYSFRGRRIRESSESQRSADAARLLRRRLGEIGRGRLVGPQADRVTFEDLEALIKNDYAINGRRSAERLRSSLIHLRAFFGRTLAIDITGDRLNAYVRQRLEEKPRAQPSTIRNELAALRRAFTLAIQAGRLVDRPAFPTLSVQNARQGFFEEQAVRAVVAAAPDWLAPVIEFGYLTGWRKREVLGLTWARVDLDAGWVRLEPGTTKSGEGRAFPLRGFPELETLLRGQRERTEAVQRQTGKIVPWVFHHRGGLPIVDFRDSWDTACEAAGVPGRLFHDLRRTAVRNLERAGVSRSAAMKLTGHKTESVYRRYAIVAEADLLDAVAKVAQHQARLAAGAAARAVVPFPGPPPRVGAQKRHKSARSKPRGEAGNVPPDAV
ncbi:MAG TPA: site-specific integrase [Verrucomicrobiae bacterium]|nr:site-specific integrase [Verrucomicrobiae bacterium]